MQPKSSLWHKFCPEMALLSLPSTRNQSNIWSGKMRVAVHSLHTSISKEESFACTAVAGVFPRRLLPGVICFSHGNES